ncbi:hypothetical protein C7S18_08085 [Ahniella affigens]|uniref:Carrier domain-containing protein n=1 Tax=Ahniella affigens TaxID=2021234 RepID=A0A2P1PQP3_9GAMM|nr:amino acid adenylation domain-containing protein [Ahniella affigens]AVP97154.1 hypothetical protein C7S18_08085 [Ahniella affigens]
MTLMIDSVLALIERRVLAAPHAIAIESGTDRVSYAALWQRVAAIAAQLDTYGLRAGDAVGVALPRGSDWVASLLAILKSGLVYVPVNPALPRARQYEMADIASMRLLLTDARQDWAICPALNIAGCQPSASVSPVNAVIETALAYLIFTSGTSGTPKAVAISHGNLVVHCGSISNAYRLRAEDRVLQTCAIGFDISIEEVIPTLCAGACLVIAPDQIGLRAGGLTGFLAESAISVANLPTALWSAWVDELRAGVALPSALRCVVVGGEACPIAKIHAWNALAATRGVLTVNAYGPTETTITSTLWIVRDRPAHVVHVPIGEALPGAHAYVLDPTGAPAGSGELFLGGALVGQGYVAQPALTAAAFVPDPFSNQPGARMYRTGDQVHWNLDGALILTGRVDRQIKLRGYRIEPAEIERRLERAPGVRAAVVKRCMYGVQPVLVAYVATAAAPLGTPQFFTAQMPAVASMSASVNALPDYMRPAWYVLLSAMPLNANDKLDYRGLPELPVADESADASGAERLVQDPVVDCIRQCLGRDPNDWSLRFFEAGGDSIQAVRVLAALRQRGFGLSASTLLTLPMGELSCHVTTIAPVSAPANAIDHLPPDLTPQEHLRLRNAVRNWTDVEQVSVLTPVQLGMVYRSLHAVNEGRYVEQVEGVLEDLDVHRFQRAWRHVIARHGILRASFSLLLPNKPLLLFRRQVEMDWQTVDWTGRSDEHDETLASWLAADRARGFDLTEGPLQRFHLAALDQRRIHFCWSYHHALLDGWSDIDVLDQVFDQYARVEDASDPAPSPATSFSTYVKWLQRQDSASSAAFWQNRLRSLDPRKPWLIATDTMHATPNVLRLECRLDSATTTAIRSAAQSAGCTLNTALVAAWGASVAELKACPEVVLGGIVAIRPVELGPEVIGPMLNLLPQRLSLPKVAMNWSSWLAQLQQLQSAALDHQYLGLDQIERAESGPLFDTLFVFENYPAARHPSARALRSHTQTEFPLSLLVWPDAMIKIEILLDTTRVSTPLLEQLWAGFLRALKSLADDRVIAGVAASTGAAEMPDCVELEI